MAFRSMRSCVLLLFLLAPAGGATVISSTPGGFAFDGSVDEWRHISPIRTTGRPRSAEEEAAWAGVSRTGLVIAGRFPASALRERPAVGRGPMSLPRVDIWLAITQPFELPEVKFSDEACGAPAREVERADCLHWRDEQLKFRERLQKQFVRMWRIGTSGGEEAYARPAFDELSEGQRAALHLPRPEGVPQGKFRGLADGGMEFEALVRWELFPPADRLHIDQLRLAVTLEPINGRDDEPTDPFRADLPAFSVWPPVTTRITPCGQPLLGRNLHGEDEAAFYSLNSRLQTDEAFFFENDEDPYESPLPKPGDVSPRSRAVKFFAEAVGPGEYLCGPFLSFRKGSIAKGFPFRLEPPQDQISTLPERPLNVRLLPDGSRLIQYGPDIAHGPLWHRDYRVYSLAMYLMSPSLEVYEALSLGAWSDGVAGYEIEVSNDGRTVKEFRQSESGTWSSETFCLTGHAYRSCAKDPKSKPPLKRILTRDE
jgi:hypothetical protein